MRSSIALTADSPSCMIPPLMARAGLYGIKLAYDKAGKKIAMDQTITENWSTGATTA